MKTESSAHDLRPENQPSKPDTAYEEWFRQEVEAAIAEADSPDAEWDSEEAVKSLSVLKRAEWMAAANAATKATA